MEWIIPSCELTEKLGGVQKPRAGVRYRLTKHCITCPCPAGTLAYHTLTGALVLLRQGEDWETERDALIENRYLVPEDADERVFADQLSSIALMLGRKGNARTAFTILTTTDCNARCYYCYELGIRRIPMTEQTALDTADYITRVCKGKPVKLSWFGGEPLYNRTAIERICARLRENHIEYESGMVSNGFYLDAGTAQHAAGAWNLKKVQITLDGPEQEYNRIKAYIDKDENPYRRVMANIRGALDAGIRVVIRLNMDASNAASLLRLADDLGEAFREGPRPEVYAALLHAFAGKIHEHDTDDEAEKAFFALCDRLDAHGLLRRKELQTVPRTVRCMADDDAAEVILPDGRVGRCEHFSEAMVSGSIYSESRDATVTKAWKEPLRVPECADCALYPQCRKLKRCEWNLDGCSGLERRIRTKQIRKQMLDAFTEYTNGGEEK